MNGFPKFGTFECIPTSGRTNNRAGHSLVCESPALRFSETLPLPRRRAGTGRLLFLLQLLELLPLLVLLCAELFLLFLIFLVHLRIPSIGCSSALGRRKILGMDRR